MRLTVATMNGSWQCRPQNMKASSASLGPFTVSMHRGPSSATCSLPGANLLGARADLPILTYRFTTDPVAIGPFTIETGGPLAALSEGANREWLEALMANHALPVHCGESVGQARDVTGRAN